MTNMKYLASGVVLRLETLLETVIPLKLTFKINYHWMIQKVYVQLVWIMLFSWSTTGAMILEGMFSRCTSMLEYS